MVDESVVRESAEQIAKAIAHGRRLEALEILAQSERSVEALARSMSSSVSTVSAQLQVLRRAGLVRSRREGTTIHYRIAGPEVAQLLVALNSLAGTQASGRGHAREEAHDSRGTAPVIDTASLTAEMLVLDVRSEVEYRAAHLPGAASIPWDELPQRWEEIPQDRNVVVYCRSGWCETAQEAAQFLRRQGLDAASMDEGVVEWRAARRIDPQVPAG